MCQQVNRTKIYTLNQPTVNLPRLTTKVLLVIMLAVGVYTSFVIFSDISLLASKFQSFNFAYIPMAMALVLGSYVIRAIRWDTFLKLLGLDIQKTKSFLIFFAGLALGITPGKFGEVIKSLFLKRDYDQSISKTAPIVFVERFYDLVGIVAISIFGLWFADVGRIALSIGLVLMISALVVSQQKKLLMPLLRRLENLPFFKRSVINILETYETVQK